MHFRSLLFSIPLSLGLIPSAFAVLTKSDAEMRSKQVSNIEYQIDINLTTAIYNADEDTKDVPKLPLYSGKVLVQFTASANAALLSKELFLDFSENNDGEIKNVILNGVRVEPKWNKKEGKIYIPTAFLNLGARNNLEVEFINRFTRKGKGFHRALDLADNETYLFTNLEPHHANEVFPLFDQPDLKARYLLETEVPNYWEVVSNTRETQKTPLDAHTTKWTFAKSELFSSYLFALVAGPYKVWSPKENTPVPMRLLARQSVANDVDAVTWFNITTNTFDFYVDHFGTYPFDKYDQIIVPETSSGAMENVGAVTFNESYLSNGGKRTKTERTNLIGVISHEMAHMWFGDSVTMKWWDDLWLNESFASFSAALVNEGLMEKLDLNDPWAVFFLKSKDRGYREDSYSTTHPIVAHVDNTDVAQSIFDGISYGKGAAVLKQLYYYIGKENFYKGVRNYLDKYRYQNTSRVDFMNALSQASGIDLTEWDRDWLQTRGTNSVQLKLKENSGKIEKLTLVPYADPIDKKFRVHQTQIGFYDLNQEGEIVLQKTIPITYFNNSIDIDSVVGEKAPLIAIANSGDYDFVNEVFDARNLANIKTYLPYVKNSLLKEQIYFTLGNMVKYHQMSAKEYIDLLVKDLPHENNSEVLSIALEHAKKALAYETQSQRVQNKRIADILLGKITSLNSNSAEFRSAFNNYFWFVNSQKHVGIIAGWLKEPNLSKDDRWRVIQALAANNFPSVDSIIDTELQKSMTNKNLLEANVAKVSLPHLENKKEWFKKLMTPGRFDTSTAKALVAGFHNFFHPEVTQFIEDEYFDAILVMNAAKVDSRMMEYIVKGCFPINVSQEFLTKTREFLAAHGAELSVHAKNALVQKYEDALVAFKALLHPTQLN